MRVEVKVPQLPESVAEATLVSWHKKAGEAVKRDENLIDIETDKVVLELPAPADGVLVEVLKGDGTTVTSNDIIAVLDTDGERPPQRLPRSPRRTRGRPARVPPGNNRRRRRPNPSRRRHRTTRRARSRRRHPTRCRQRAS